MKRFIIPATVPLTLVLIGCGGPGAQDVTANTTSSTASTSTAADANAGAATSTGATSTSTTSTAATSSGAGAATASSAAKQDDKNSAGPADDKYKVAEPPAGVPPEVVSALAKLKVPPPPAKMKVPDKARVRLTTSKGAITVELNGKQAPLHVKSFLYLSQRGFFNGTVFHRYEPGFVIQGGDPLSKNPKMQEFFGVGGPGYQIPREHNDLTHDKYVLAAARSQDPDSAGSQFYITLAPAPFLDQGDGYTVFGKVVDGQAVVDKLRKGDQLKSATVLK